MKPTRSSQYQWKLLEITVGEDSMKLYEAESHQRFNDEVLDLEDELRATVFDILKDNITDRQWDVIQTLRTGCTQQEAGKILGVNQSSITKAIFGNTEYNTKRHGSRGKTYGGIVRRVEAVIPEHKDRLIPILENIDKHSISDDRPMCYVFVKNTLKL